MIVRGKPLNILVIEDNPADYLLLNECLHSTSLEITTVECAPTFAQAVKILESRRFDIIFLDISLPDTNAAETFPQLIKYSRNIPVVVLSGMSDQKLALQTIQQGAQDYILKDKLEPELLSKAIAYSIERARSSEKLKESERRFRYIAENFPNGSVCFLDAELKYVFVTGGEFLVHNKNEKIVQGSRFSAYFPEEERARIEQKLKGAFAGKHVLFETPFEAQSLLISAVPAYNDNGITEHILVVSQNITDLKLAEERLHFQSNVLENITDSVIITDLEKNVTFWNKAAGSVYGYDEMEMLGNNLSCLVVDEDDGTDPQSLDKVLKEKGTVDVLVRRRRKDGRIIWVQLNITYNYTINKKITGLIGVSKDVTDKREEEYQLKLFQSVILNTHDAVIITEASAEKEGGARKIVFVNETFSKTSGYSANEVIGKTLFAFCGPQTDMKEVLRIQENLDNWETFDSEIAYYKKSGAVFWASIAIMPVSDMTGQFTHWVFLMRDITESRIAAEQLRKQNEELTKTNLELDRFVYSASHDLRAPLASVLGLISLIRKESYAAEAAVYTDKIQESVMRLDRLVQNIINYSRNSRLKIEWSKVEFKEVFETAVSMHKFMPNSGNIRFEYENKLEEHFYSDQGRWQIILNNLISNSIKFAGNNPDSIIRLLIWRDEEELVVELSDNGMGIPADQLDFVFDMFYRATTVSEGSGLGLYIVKQTVDLIGGTISAESKYGEMTRFSIRVPFKVIG